MDYDPHQSSPTPPPIDELEREAWHRMQAEDAAARQQAQMWAMQNYSVPPQAAPKEDQDRTLLMWVLSIFFHLIAPIIFFAIAEKGTKLKRQSALSLTSSLVMMVAYMIMFPVMFGTMFAGILSTSGSSHSSAFPIGMFLGMFAFYGVVFVVSLAHLVFCIVGAVNASQGRDYSPPGLSKLTYSIFKL